MVSRIQKAHVRFINFPGGSFSEVLETNQTAELSVHRTDRGSIFTSAAAGMMLFLTTCPDSSGRLITRRSFITCPIP